MALRLHDWNRRFLGLGVGMLLSASVGCTTTKDDQKPLTNQVSKTTMGPGNTVMSSPEPLTPLSPAYNNLPGNSPTVTRNPASMAPFSNTPPVMPAMPLSSSPNPQYVTQLNTPHNTLVNPSSFNQPAAPAPSANAYGPPPVYPMQQPMGGQQVVIPPLPQAPQPQSPQPQQAPPPSLPPLPSSPNQMQDIQIPPPSQPVQPYVPVPMTPPLTQQNYPNPQLQAPALPPQQMGNQVPMMQVPPTQAQPPQQYIPTAPIQSSVPLQPPQRYTPPAPVQPALPTQLQQAPSFGSPFPGQQSMNLPASNPGNNTASGNFNATAAALEGSSVGMNAKVVAAGNIKGINDPSMNIPEPVVVAPTNPGVPR